MEVRELQEILSNIHLLSEIFPPDFHEKLEQRQLEYLVSFMDFLIEEILAYVQPLCRGTTFLSPANEVSGR